MGQEERISNVSAAYMLKQIICMNYTGKTASNVKSFVTVKHTTN